MAEVAQTQATTTELISSDNTKNTTVVSEETIYVEIEDLNLDYWSYLGMFKS